MKGHTVSHYRLVEKIGAGSYGEVWKGVHLHDDALFVAVKLLHPALATDADFLAALKAECRVLARLHHPHIVGFRDLVIGESHPPAMVLSLIEGDSLEDRLQAGPQPIEAVLDQLKAMLGGLAHAHHKGVVHRDIKPGNVLVDADGSVQLVDFGIARAAESGAATRTGRVQGTMDYMPPEVFQGQKAGPAADLYAVGLVVWEQLTGRRACPDGPLAAKMGWHLATPLPDPRSLRSDCPSWLAELVARLAAKSPGDRPEDASAAIALLEARRRAPTTAPSPRPAAPQAPGTVELSPETLRAALQEAAPSAGSPSGGAPSAPSTVVLDTAVLDTATVASPPPPDESPRPSTSPPPEAASPSPESRSPEPRWPESRSPEPRSPESRSPKPRSPKPRSPTATSQPVPTRSPPTTSGKRLLAAVGVALGLIVLGGLNAGEYHPMGHGRAGDPLAYGHFLWLPVMAIGLVSLPSTDAPRRRGLAILCGLIALWILLAMLHGAIGFFDSVGLSHLLYSLGVYASPSY